MVAGTISAGKSSLRPLLARVLPFAFFIALLALQQGLARAGLIGEEGGRWMGALRGTAVAALLAFFWNEYGELRGRQAQASATLGSWFLAIAVGLGVFVLWITFDRGWAVIGGEGAGFVPLRADGSVDWLLAGLRLLGLAAVVPVMEELFWRSFLLRWIDGRDFLGVDPRKASLAALALSSALFATEHSFWFAGLIAGAAYGWLYVRSGNLWIPIVSHAVTNGSLGLWILTTNNWRYW